MLVPLNLGDDELGDGILTQVLNIVENNRLDGKVEKVDSVVNGESDDGGVIIGEDGRDTKVERLDIDVNDVLN